MVMSPPPIEGSERAYKGRFFTGSDGFAPSPPAGAMETKEATPILSRKETTPERPGRVLLSPTTTGGIHEGNPCLTLWKPMC